MMPISSSTASPEICMNFLQLITVQETDILIYLFHSNVSRQSIATNTTIESWIGDRRASSCFHLLFMQKDLNTKIAQKAHPFFLPYAFALVITRVHDLWSSQCLCISASSVSPDQKEVASESSPKS